MTSGSTRVDGPRSPDGRRTGSESVSHCVVSLRGIWGDIGVPVDQVGGDLRARSGSTFTGSLEGHTTGRRRKRGCRRVPQVGGELVATVIASQVPEGWVDHEEGRDLVMVHGRLRPIRIVGQPQVLPEPDDPLALHLLARLGRMGKNPLVRRM